MRALLGGAERGPVVAAGFVFGSLAVLTGTVLTGSEPTHLAPFIAIAVVLVIAYERLLTWPAILSGLVLVILFIPIKRYTLPGDLPFELELYRIYVVVIAFLWLAALLVDPRVRLRGTGLEAPLLLFLAAAVGSVIANPGRVAGVSSYVVKELTFFMSFLLVLWLIVSVVRTFEVVEQLVKILAGAGAVVAIFALIEARSGYNVFDHLSGAVPFLEVSNGPDALIRGGKLRVYASSQGPISLGAAFVMLVPLGAYLANRRVGRSHLWWAVTGLLAIGALATLSRTSVVMLLALIAVFAWLRWTEIKRLWPALIPLVVVVHLAVPGTIGTLRSSFFPEGGLIAQQHANPGWRGSGRLADLGPSLDEYAQRPLLGQGFGTRLTGREQSNAQILDNQWLKTLLETGIVGMVALIWFFGRFIRRLGRAAKDDRSDYGWLCAALTGSIASFAVGMFFFDSFSFIQVTFLLFILSALGCVLLKSPRARTT